MNELTIDKKELISLIGDHDLGDVIKPLIQEVHLFDTHIAGTTHLEDKEVLDEVKIGDILKMKREKNKFDDNAILILNEDGKKLGYVPEKDNVVFSRLMDAGKLLIGKVMNQEDKGSWKYISVSIFLVDY